MDKHIICLANSYKRGGRCIAGIEITFNSSDDWAVVRDNVGLPKWIRPIAMTTYGEIPNNVASRIDCFSVIKLTDITLCPKQFHVEDVYYSTMEYCCQIQPTFEILNQFIDNIHDKIFYNQGRAISTNSTEPSPYSLMIIRPDNVSTYVNGSWEKPKTRMLITYRDVTYDLPVTDPVFLDHYKANPNLIQDSKNVYLTLSLGLEFEGWHHKLVASVFHSISENEARTSASEPSSNKWIVKEERSFTEEEIGSILNAVVVANQYGKSLCFYMKAGGQSYIPLSPNCDIGTGETVDIRRCKLVTLGKAGHNDIFRVCLETDNTTKPSYIEQQKQLHRNAYAKWTKEEDTMLLRLHSEGKSINQLMEYFGRNQGSIISRLNKLDGMESQTAATHETTEHKSLWTRLFDLVNKKRTN